MTTGVVYFYTYTAIVPSGAGTNIRQFTNARAYLDLGLRVHVIHITLNPGREQVVLPDGAEYSPLSFHSAPPRWRDRLAYKVGIPFDSVLRILYSDRQELIRVVLNNERTSPRAIHHFEYPATANVAISLGGKKLNLIWSCHDWESDRNRKLNVMRAEAGRQKSAVEIMRRSHYACQVEKRIGAASKLVLMIAEHETRLFREQLGIVNAELLPISWPDETMPARTRPWVEGGTLRLLHVGSPDAMVGYYSLKFILSEVFPRLPTYALDRMELWVAGKIQDTEYSRVIRQLAWPYPQVKFLGFVEDIRSLYAQTDIHLVGNAVATGLRTRIIESFVCGIPVLSISPAAKGITGLKAGQNILLEDDPAAFALTLTRLLVDSSVLMKLARAGRSLYDRFYTRSVAVSTLRNLLGKYGILT